MITNFFLIQLFAEMLFWVLHVQISCHVYNKSHCHQEKYKNLSVAVNVQRQWMTTCSSDETPYWPCALTPLGRNMHLLCLCDEWWMAYHAVCAVVCMQSICFLHRREFLNRGSIWLQVCRTEVHVPQGQRRAEKTAYLNTSFKDNQALLHIWTTHHTSSQPPPGCHL